VYTTARDMLLKQGYARQYAIVDEIKIKLTVLYNLFTLKFYRCKTNTEELENLAASIINY